LFPIVRSLAAIGEDLSAKHGELFQILLKAGEHSDVALLQYRTAVPLDVAGACTLLLFGSTVLRHGGADNKDIVVHGDLRLKWRCNCPAARARNAGIELSRKLRSGSDHHQIDAAVFEAFPRQTIPCHQFDPVPVLTKIARSLMLGRKFGLQTAGLTRIPDCDLEKHYLLPFFLTGLCPRSIAHRLRRIGLRRASAPIAGAGRLRRDRALSLDCRFG
jgi:hypothetical protein